MKLLVVVEVAVIAAMGWAVHLVRQPYEFRLDPVSFDRLPAIGLALTLGTVIVVGLGAAHWRLARREVVLGLGTLAVTVILGATRLLTSPAETIAVACWLSSAAAVLAATVIGSRALPTPPARPLRLGLAVVALLGVLAAALGIGGSVVSPIEPGAGGRIALAAQLLALLVFVAWLATHAWRRTAGPSRPALTRDPVLITALVWSVAAAWERAVHLLPASTYLLIDRGGYRPWSLASALYLPLLTTVALVVAVGWSVLVRPRVERLANGIVIVPDDDPLTTLRDDLAAWTGDPTLQLAYADATDGWVTPLGEIVPEPAAYHRARTVVTHDGRPIGMIDHDLALAQAPDALETAAAMAGVAFHANQLLALSEARLAETRRLGRRLLLADASTRDTMRVVLEVGPIDRLTAAAAEVRSGAPVAGVVADLQQATTEIRILSHGLYPPELLEGGLRAVVGDRPGVPGRRLPGAVEITAFLLAADDPGSRFEDRGSALGVHRTRPIEDDDLLDRIEVLGGAVTGCSATLPVPLPEP